MKPYFLVKSLCWLDVSQCQESWRSIFFLMLWFCGIFVTEVPVCLCRCPMCYKCCNFWDFPSSWNCITRRVCDECKSNPGRCYCGKKSFKGNQTGGSYSANSILISESGRGFKLFRDWLNSNQNLLQLSGWKQKIIFTEAQVQVQFRCALLSTLYLKLFTTF